MKRNVPLDLLARLVCQRSSEGSAFKRCCDALRVTQFPYLEATETTTSELRDIYRRRFAGKTLEKVPVDGADGILPALERYPGERVMLVLLERDRDIYACILNDAGTELLTCFVGSDRRQVLPAPQ